MSTETREMMKKRLASVFEEESAREEKQRSQGHISHARNTAKEMIGLATAYALLDAIDEQVTQTSTRTIKRQKSANSN